MRSASSISRCGSRKQPGPEVRGDTEGENIDAQFIHDPRQLLDLVGGVELRFVADQVVHGGPGMPAGR